MTWSWSHTQEGIQNVENNICELNDTTLATVWTEWTCAVRISGEFVLAESAYDRIFAQACKMVDTLRTEMVDFIIDKTNALAECTNGGFEAHICPFGCHTASFDVEEEIEQDDPDHNFR